MIAQAQNLISAFITMEEKMQRTKKLAFNTALFAISNFGSRGLAFLLIPFYTAVLSTDQYGTIDLVITANSLLMPIITLSMSEAVMRFALDHTENSKDVFTTGVFIISIGSLISFVLVRIVSVYLCFSEYWLYATIILCVNSFYLLSSQFCRGISQNITFAISGVIQTLALILSNLFFLLVLSWNIEGYLISLIISYFVPLVFIFMSAKLHRYLGGQISKALLIKMLKYSAPLIPNTILWWIMNASNKVFIVNILGASFNGIYAIANKLPSAINLVSIVFYQAWQLTAIEESEAKDSGQYYSKVFEGFSSVVLLMVSIIILFLKPIYSIYVAKEYFDAWMYTPILLFAIAFMCFSSFWGSILAAFKKTQMVLVASLSGGSINLLLNVLLIKNIGLYGAAISTAGGFLIVWIVQYCACKRYVEVTINWFKLCSNFVFIILQSVLVYQSTNYAQALSIIIFICVMVLNRHFLCEIMNIIRNKINKRGSND